MTQTNDNSSKNTPATLGTVLLELESSLKNDEAKLEAKIILETILEIRRTDFITKAEMPITQAQLLRIRAIRDERNTSSKPLAYLLEEAPFMDMKLFVNSDVLIPRPETELLVEAVLAEIKRRNIHQPTILDLCTGSGCIAIALKKSFPAATVYASDISKAALHVASINAQRYGAEIRLVLGDYLDPFINASLRSEIAVPIMRREPPYFDVIVSNPPYLSEEEYQNVAAELFFEPKHALVGFPYEHIKKQALPLIKEGGFMAFEFGLGQADKLRQIFAGARIYRDLGGIERYFFWDTKET